MSGNPRNIQVPKPQFLPTGLPLVGQLPYFLPDKLGFLMLAAATGEAVVPLQLGRRTFLLNDADDIRHVLVGNHANYDKSTRLTGRRGRRLAGNGLLTRANPDHLALRRMLQPAFYASRLPRFDEPMVATVDRAIGTWDPRQPIDMAAQMMAITSRIIGQIAFSMDYEGKDEPFATAIYQRRQYIQYVFNSFPPFPEYWPTPITLRYRRASRLIDRTIHAQIRRRATADRPPDDLLTTLVNLRDREGVGLSSEQIRDEALTLAITGYETAGTALTWTLYLLCKNPDIEHRLREEIDSVLGDEAPTSDALDRMPYSLQVVCESMRLYPPTWIFLRVARQADTLPSGHTIPPGGKLYLCPYVTHRNPAYFSQPEIFDPARFSTTQESRHHRHAYFPFGAGPRVCIGKALAEMQILITLVRVLQRARLELFREQPIEAKPGIILWPRGGVPMTVKRL